MTASAFTATRAPRADRFRPGDHWRGCNGHLYLACPAPALAHHVILRPLRGGASVVESAWQVARWRRVKWGGEA